jgi:hypothetical protein
MVEIREKVEAEERGVPDAPFRNDLWISLGMKTAIVEAVEGGYEAISWPNAEVLVDRWSESYRKLYETQYEKKMVSIVRKLTGETPVEMDLEGKEIPSLGKGVPPGYKVEEAVGEQRLVILAPEGDEAGVGEKGFRGVKLAPPEDDPERPHRAIESTSGVYKNKQDAIKWTHEMYKQYEDKGEQGYFIVKFSPELIEKVKNEGLPLYQPGVPSDPRGFFDPSSSTMGFTKKADLTTFLHEASPFLLRCHA